MGTKTLWLTICILNSLKFGMCCDLINMMVMMVLVVMMVVMMMMMIADDGGGDYD